MKSVRPPPVYEMISQKIFFFTIEGFPNVPLKNEIVANNKFNIVFLCTLPKQGLTKDIMEFGYPTLKAWHNVRPIWQSQSTQTVVHLIGKIKLKVVRAKTSLLLSR